MDILYTINKNYLDYMLASFYSVYLNGGLKYINLHIIYSDLETEDIVKISKFVSLLHNVDLKMYKVNEDYLAKYGLPNFRDTQISNARLFFQDIINDLPKKLLYLDSDTICVDRININVDDVYSVYAVKDYVSKRKILERCLFNYFNSGVLYINTDKWIKHRNQERFIDYAKGTIEKFTFPDQDVLNYTLPYEIGSLPIEYNLSPYPYMFNDNQLKVFYNKDKFIQSYDEIKEALKNPKIIHSVGLFSIKPWQKNNVNPFNETFRNYIQYINPSFTPEEMNKIKKLISINPFIFNNLVMLKALVPSEINTIMSEVALKLQRKK